MEANSLGGKHALHCEASFQSLERRSAPLHLIQDEEDEESRARKEQAKPAGRIKIRARDRVKDLQGERIGLSGDIAAHHHRDADFAHRARSAKQ